MKAIKTLLKITFIILLTSGCIDKEKALEGELIQSDSMVNQKQFIKESQKRADKVLPFGPQISEIDDTDIRDASNTMINKEDAPDYDTLQDNGSGNIFPVDLNVENVEIRTFTQMLSRITGINFLVSDEVSGFVTAKLSDVSWPNALDSVLSLKNLAKHVDNEANIIRIHSQSVIVALESFERQRKTDLQQTALLDRANEPLYTEIFKLFYTKPEEVKTILESVLGSTETSGEGRNTNAQFTIDNRVNQLIVKAREDDLQIIKKLIKKIDSRTKQVFIEAFIVEVTDDFEKALGVSLGLDAAYAKEKGQSGKTFNVRVAGPAASATGAAGTGANLAEAAVTSFFPITSTSGIAGLVGLGDLADLKIALGALEKDEISKIISNPRIFTLDNQEATIFQGTEVPYETVSADGTSIEFKNAGLNLAVTPKVIGDGNLMMAISLNKDSVDLTKSNPPITSSAITTNLVTKDGSIVVIGGIYTQTKSDGTDKTPFLGDVPGVGKLFRKDSRADNKKELMIFIAPRII